MDPRALAAAVRAIHAARTADGPVLLAVDDDQWADRSSVAALEFAVRRLPESPIRLLLARRTYGAAPVGGGSERSLLGGIEPDAVERVRVGPLSIGAIQSLLRTHLGVALSRPNLVRLADASGGNAFFAIELARAQPPASGPPGPLFVPASLERLLVGRFERLDEQTRHALLLIAAHGRTSLEALRRLDVRSDALDRAVDEQLLESLDGVIRFAHPLLASTVYQRATSAERRGAHVELAAVVDDPIARARHLALGTAEPDEALAADLEAAAAVARSRGLPIVAAELAEQAGRLTPPDRTGDSLRRGALAARAHLAAGAPDRARAILSAQLSGSAAGPSRATALLLAAELEEPAPATALLEQALDEAGGAPGIETVVRVQLAQSGRFLHGREWAERHPRAALDAAERSRDDALRARALAMLAELRFEGGDPGALELALEAHRVAVADGDPDAIRSATWAVGHQLTWLRRNDEARAWFERALIEAERDEIARASCIWYLALIEIAAGRWEAA